MRGNFKTTWTPEQDDALRGYIAGGLSLATAARLLNAEFKTSFTRNAAIGRAHRLRVVNPKPPRRTIPLSLQERNKIKSDRLRNMRHAAKPWLRVAYERSTRWSEEGKRRKAAQEEARKIFLANGTPKTSPVYRKHMPRLGEMTRNEMRAMLTAAVQNTAAMEILQ